MSEKPKPPRRLTLTLPEKNPARDLLPYVKTQDALNDPFRPGADEGIGDPLSTRVPVNRQALKQAELYRKQLPLMMEARIDAMRDFFLNEVAPVLLATTNGLADAKEVLTNALGEEPSVQSYFSRIERAMDLALEVRIWHFISDTLQLDPAMKREFLLMSISKEVPGESLKTLLHEVLSLKPEAKQQPVASGRRMNRRTKR